jgi:hypothetical protein
MMTSTRQVWRKSGPDRNGSGADIHQAQSERRVKDVVLNLDCNDSFGRDAEAHGTVAHAVNESRQPRVADDAQRSARRAHGRRRRVVPRLKENRFDDIHRNSAEAARAVATQRCRYATYAVGNARASSEQMTRCEK